MNNNINDIQATINRLNECIMTYRDTNPSDGNSLLAIAQEISTLLYFLSEEKTRQHDNWQRCVYDMTTNKGMNVNRAENAAYVMYPQLYHLRYIIRAGNEVLNIIRSQVSFLKAELSSL